MQEKDQEKNQETSQEKDQRERRDKHPGKHKAFLIVILILAVWLTAFCADAYAVGIKGRAPLFCVETKKGSCHYVGLGYSYDAYGHPLTKEYQYALYLFGKMVKCTFTN